LSHEIQVTDLNIRFCVHIADLPVDEKNFDAQALNFDLNESSSRRAEAFCHCCSRRWWSYRI